MIIMLLLVFMLAGSAGAALPEHTPTGVLIDRVLPLSRLDRLDGSADAPAATLSRWRQAVHEMSRAAEVKPDWPDIRALQDAALANIDPREIPLAVLLGRYDRMDGVEKTATAEVFAAAVLREDCYHGARIVFSLDPAHVLVQGSTRPIRYRINPDDGAGWRELDATGRLEVAYTTSGRKTVRLQAELDDGRIVHAAASLDVKRLETPPPTETWTITATETWLDIAGTGQAYVYLSDQHTTLTNPVIVVEGFDLDNTMDWPVLYDLLNQHALIDDLRAYGYDAVVLDFTEATEPIQRNAFVLTELLSQVNLAIDPDRTSALIGASMGGLVVRYALTWLEQQGEDHKVRSFISFDAPQTGADIPLGLQHWLHFFQSESTDAAYLLSRLDTPAARQMLLYHHQDPPTGSGQADPLFTDFQADLAALGDWPSGPRLVAVANGSGAGVDQGFAPGEQLIRYEYRSFLIDIDGNVWAVPDNTSTTIFDGMLNVIWPLPDTYQTVSVSGTLPWDSAPGGWRSSMAQMDTTAVEYGDIVALHDHHCFIPTISALALDVADPFHDIAGDPDLMSRTPFDQLYFPAENQEHISITAENKVWFIEEIEWAFTGVESTPAVAAAVLYPAAPNPFNPSTAIRFELARAEDVRLQVYDLTGRVVRTLFADRPLDPGLHTATWDGRRDNGHIAASGVYMFRLEAGEHRLHRRATLIK